MAVAVTLVGEREREREREREKRERSFIDKAFSQRRWQEVSSCIVS
jgi:hypothetical protein